MILKDLLRQSRNMAEGVRTSLGSYLIKSKTDRRGLRAFFANAWGQTPNAWGQTPNSLCVLTALATIPRG